MKIIISAVLIMTPSHKVGSLASDHMTGWFIKITSLLYWSWDVHFEVMTHINTNRFEPMLHFQHPVLRRCVLHKKVLWARFNFKYFDHRKDNTDPVHIFNHHSQMIAQYSNMSSV